MSSDITAEQAKTLAQEAYVFGFPLVYIQTQVDALTHVTKPEGTRAPLNQFAHYREFPDASNKTVVGFNVDTLYSIAQLDLSREPMILSVPEMGDRFWITQIIDGWNNVPHAPGTRTAGDKGGNFALVGPGWQGTLPAGINELRMPTSIAAIARPHLHRRPRRLCGRTRASGSVQVGAALGLGHGLHAAQRRAAANRAWRTGRLGHRCFPCRPRASSTA